MAEKPFVVGDQLVIGAAELGADDGERHRVAFDALQRVDQIAPGRMPRLGRFDPLELQNTAEHQRVRRGRIAPVADHVIGVAVDHPLDAARRAARPAVGRRRQPEKLLLPVLPLIAAHTTSRIQRKENSEDGA